MAVDSKREIQIETIRPERLAAIKHAWIGKNERGLATTGNESYRQVAELIEGYEVLQRGVDKLLGALASAGRIENNAA